MELEAKIEYRNSKARFKIQDEREGIFTANLIDFEGDNSFRPPQKITLVKGVRNWTGSIEDDILLNELGKYINEYWVLSK